MEEEMRRFLMAVTLFASFCSTANAGPKEDAQAVFDKFLTSFTAADMDGVVGLFWPDAQFWGTTLPNLATTPEAVRDYSKPGLGTRKPNEAKATLAGTPSLLVLSD